MLEVINFAQGLNPNAAYTKFRNTTARNWKNLRVNSQGFLEVRNGHSLLYDTETVSQIFLYKTLMIGVVDAKLKWARIDDDDDSITFNDFSPVINLNATRLFNFYIIDNATGEYIFMGNGTGELTGGLGGLYVIDLTDVFDFENPQDPKTYHPYMNRPNAPTYEVVDAGDDDSDLERLIVAMKLQYVTLNEDGGRIAVSQSTDAVRITDVNTLKDSKVIGDLGDTADQEASRTVVRIRYNLPQGSISADEINLYITNPFYDEDDLNIESDDDRVYYLASRHDIPPSGTISEEYTFDVTDFGFRERNRLVEQGDRVAWRFIEVDGVRSYVISPFSDKLYLSYFNAETSERLYRNYTDHISLPTGGEEITGLKFLPETPWLVAYTPSQIIMVLTDPNPELIQVIGRYGTLNRDEDIGCIAPQSLVAVGRYHYFLGGNKRVYSFAGRQPNWVSHKVQPILNKIIVPSPFKPVNAHGVVHEGDYYLSFETSEEPSENLLIFREENVMFREDEEVEVSGANMPNTTLILDTERAIWYRDGFGVTSFIKNATGRLYGVIEGDVYSLYDTDDDDDIGWLWQSNMLLLPVQQLIHNINVKLQGSGDVTVKAKTEEGEQTRTLEVEDANHYWGQRAGVNLRGRTLDVTLAGVGPVTIDRLTVNERPRRRNLR